MNTTVLQTRWLCRSFSSNSRRNQIISCSREFESLFITISGLQGPWVKPNLILHPKLQFKPYRINLNFDLNGTNFLTHFKWILKLEIVATEIEIRNAHSYQTGPKCSFPSKMQKFLVIYTTQYPPLSWMISYWHCNFFWTCSYPTRGVCV